MFYVLLEAHREDPEQFVPAWKFTGEILIKELGIYYFMSYKCPANGVNIYFENPNMMERRMTTGRSGAKYYEYRLVAQFGEHHIHDKAVAEFYQAIKQEEHAEKSTGQEVPRQDVLHF